MKIKYALLAATLLFGGSGIALAQMSSGMSSMSSTTDPMVGGAAMYPSKNIVANAVNSKDHTTLVAAVKAAGLVPTLEGAGPFTVFAPTNEAFAALPAGTVNHVAGAGEQSQVDGHSHLSRGVRQIQRGRHQGVDRKG